MVKFYEQGGAVLVLSAKFYPGCSAPPPTCEYIERDDSASHSTTPSDSIMGLNAQSPVQIKS